MNKEVDKPSEKAVVLTSQEQKLVEVIRSIDFGEVRIVINNGKPTRIEKTKSIKL